MVNMVLNILFVCYENICRSPMAEGVFRWYALTEGLAHCITVASAGTRSYQRGSFPDERAVAAASGFGIDISPIRARCIDELDLGQFDWIFVMDHENYEDVGLITGFAGRPQVRLVMSFVPGRHNEEIADPYYGTERDFRRVMDDLFLASSHILPALAELHRFPEAADA
ncbi:low molecular weight protein-tyrosine-phosphatase [Chlorobium sp.]|uniref:low molecular weight protein-tyrosine-phosphatase n=1 Tax=Chlorobium sp. TaxID=1095 RepID=UPI0025C6C4F5|nr:low molecular weight protein-tyrosine-phosphatase [Chlorobium sp.]